MLSKNFKTPKSTKATIEAVSEESESPSGKICSVGGNLKRL